MVNITIKKIKIKLIRYISGLLQNWITQRSKRKKQKETDKKLNKLIFKPREFFIVFYDECLVTNMYIMNQMYVNYNQLSELIFGPISIFPVPTP